MTEHNTQHMHEEHQDWLTDVTFWHNELVYFTNVVTRLAEKTQKREDEERMEEFKSRFDAMQEKFTKVRDSIQAHERVLERADGQLHDDPDAGSHEKMRGKMKEFRREFQKLKNDFYEFSDKGHWW